MRRFWIILPLTLAAGVAAAQAPLTPPASQPAYGGYALPQAVPYQPTLTAPPVTPPAGPAMVHTPPAGPVSTLPAPVVIMPLDGPQSPAAANPERIMPQYPATGIPPGGVPLVPAPGDVTYSGIVPGGAAPIASPQPIYPATPEPGQGESLLPPGTRDGVFQKVKFTATYMPQLQSDSLGWTDLRGEVVFGLPFFTRETPIVITPAYELHFLDRPADLDLPPRLNDITIDFHHFRRIGDGWIIDLAVTPGLYADDHSLDESDAIRVNGRGMGIYEASPQLKYLLGAAYWNGLENPVVPIAGVVYTPDDDRSYDFVFPRPKFSWRLPNSPVPGTDEYWFYIMAEFGGAIWAIDQNGSPETFSYRDWRALMGFEHKIIGDVSRRIEFGYVFNRHVDFSDGPQDAHIDDTLLVRVGLVY